MNPKFRAYCVVDETDNMMMEVHKDKSITVGLNIGENFPHVALSIKDAVRLRDFLVSNLCETDYE